MYKVINGWTKDKMKAQIMSRNSGKRSGDFVGSDGEDTGFDCKYRGSEGNACAVGCFITEQDYKSLFEDCNLEEVMEKVGLDKFPLNNKGLRAMQEVHDKADDFGSDVRELICDWIDFNVID